MKAAKDLGVRAVSVAGGVSANSELRARMKSACEEAGLQYAAPRMDYAVDNAAMIGFLS